MPKPQKSVGVAWYSAEQWTQLREVSSDRDALEERYADWKANAEAKMKQLRAMGLEVKAIPVDVDALTSWCRERARPVNEPSRAAFMASLRSGK